MSFEDEPVPGLSAADPARPHLSGALRARCCAPAAFAVTSELAPPDSADPEDVYRRARIFDGYVDAINATDGSGANCHMSSLAVCALLTRVGYAPVMQISCRDKNRIAIQGDILGGAAMGVCNILCLTGDGVQAGDHPQALPVFDLDSMSLLRDRVHAARRAPLPQRPQDQLRAARAARGRREPVRAAGRVPRPAPGQEGGRRRAVHPDPVLLRRAAAARSSCGTSRSWGCSTRCSSWWAWVPSSPPRRPSGSARTCPGCTFPTAVDCAPQGRQPTRRARAASCASTLVQEIRAHPRRARRPPDGVPPGRGGRRDHRPLRGARGPRALASGTRPRTRTPTG